MSRVVEWSEEWKEQALALLQRYQETSMFLLSNYRECGPRQGESMYSGNFKCIVNDNKVVAVFCQTKNGHILLQTDRQTDYSSLILERCLKENISIAGCTGAWELAEPLWDIIKGYYKGLVTDFYSKELLYSKELTPTSQKNDTVRFLTSDDFEQWQGLNIDYFSELDFPLQGSLEDRNAVFEEKTQQQHWWGLFDGDTLIAIAAFNAAIDHMAQIGGVYVLPEHRRKGRAKQVMAALISDAYHVHNIKKLILFTDEDNNAAQHLYQQLGFDHIGDYGLIFGKAT